jgi:Glycosyl transferase family 2
MNNPLVSVVMVVCNVDRFLTESIESILGQTFRDFEFIIVDFGSTDKSKWIALSYAAKDSRIKFHEIHHCSLAMARNAACSLAQGRYIAMMDADDVSLSARLTSEVEFMNKHPEVGLLGGLTQCINATGESLAIRIHDIPTEHHEIKSALAARCPFCQATVLIRKEAFDLVGGYREVFAQAEDYDLWLRISERFQCAGLQQVVLSYRVHPYQLSIHKQRQQTLCRLAAQASASLRRNGKPDPLNSVKEITPAVLADLGVPKTRMQSDLAADCRDWIRNMYEAGEYSVALEAALGMLQSDLQYVERWRIADLHLTAARIYWRQRRFLSSFLAAGRAMMTRPIVLGHPLKLLLRRVGLA